MRAVLIALLCIISVAVAFAACLMPVNEHVVKGTLTDYLLNDNGFDVKIDGKIYWLDFEGNITEIPPVLNQTYLLEHFSSVFFPTGTPFAYAHTVKFSPA